MTYANGYTEASTYDAQGNILTVKENGTLMYSYQYDLAGNVLEANDHKLGRTDVYYQTSGGYSSIVVTYDNDGDVYTVSSADGTIRLPDGSLYVSMPEGYAYGENGTDELMRSLGMALTYLAPDAAEGTPATTIFSVTYTYTDTKTEYVTTETFSGGSVYSYTYDKLGNLTEIKENGILKVTYTYDELCQLVREDNAYENKSFTWTYDAGGNILSKKEYAYTTGTLGAVTDTVTYTYGDGDWKDLLTNYNGTAITYDASGNPLNWRNASAMTWDGRRLSSMTLTDGTVMSFAYNADGLRTRKTVGNETVEYVWVNGELISEIRDNYTLHFYYENGEVIGFNYKTSSTSSNYYYGKDTLGVIRYLYDANGTVVTTYTYDAWGRSVGCVGTLAGTIGAVNPIRYKSYYLDAETGFYYLQSRYYDPVVGRFINADEPIEIIQTDMSIRGTNGCGYCYNDPLNMYDSTGRAPNYINDQRHTSVSGIRWGLFGNTKKNGCGWISVFNVMRSYSNKITYNYVIRGLTAANGVLGFGLLGANPTGITDYLHSKFFLVYNAGPITTRWGIISELSGAIIVLYQHKGWNSSLHYVAGIKTGSGEGGRFRFYNDNYYRTAYDNSNKYKHGTVVSISIWQYIDLLKSKGCKILMIWGVAGKKGWW